MDRQLLIESQTEQPGWEETADAGGSQLDIIAIVWRHLGLYLSVVTVSVLLGVLFFLKAPPTYQSHADILLESKKSPAFSSESYRDGRNENQKSIETHMYIMTSPRIVRGALDSIGLQNLPSLADVADRLAFVLDDLTVELKGNDSSVVSLQYRGANAEDCYKIVSAITESYEGFLGESSKNVGEETTSLITEAKDELMVQAREKEKRYDDFRQNAPLLWEEGKGVNPHQLRQLQVERARADLLIERSQLSGKIKVVEEILAKGGEDEKVLYYEALKELLASEADETLRGDQIVDRQTAQALASNFATLLMEENRLSEEYGEGHPNLQSVRRQLGELRQQLLDVQSRMLPFVAQNDLPIGSLDGTALPDIDYVSIYLGSLQARISTLDQQIAEMDDVFDEEQEKARALQVHLVQDETLRRDVQRTQDLFDAVVARLDEINIIRDHGGDRISLMSTPEVGKRVAPGLLKSLVVAGMLGVLAGMGLVYVVDQSEKTFRSPAEIQRVLRVPVIGRIPLLKRRSLTVSEDFPNISPHVITLHQHGSNPAEAYRAVRTSLFFSTGGDNHKVIQITSPLPGDGKSILAANLAITIARSGKRVLLIDADFRRPTQHKLFGLGKESQIRLAEVVTGHVEPADENLQTDVENLYVMLSGQQPHNPSELVTAPEFKELLDSLRNRFDFVLLDTPPLLAVTDPSAVAARVDGVLLTLRLRRGIQVAALRARELLANVDANVLGVVVNAVADNSRFGRQRFGHGYGYGYGHEYDSEEDAEKANGKIPRPHQLALQTNDSEQI